MACALAAGSQSANAHKKTPLVLVSEPGDVGYSSLSVPRDQRQLIAGQILCIGGAIGRLERSPAPTILLPEVIDLLRSS